MNKLFLTAAIMLLPFAAFCQDDALPLVVVPVPAALEVAAPKLSTEARSKLNTEWMYNNISGLPGERILCLLQLNRDFLDSFALAEEMDAAKRLKAQERAVDQREAALKECLGDASFGLLKELREKQNYTPGSPAKGTAAATSPVIQAAPESNPQKPGRAAAAAPSTEAIQATMLSDLLEGEQQ